MPDPEKLATLTRADAVALWHAVEAFKLSVRVMRDMSPEVQAHIPAEQARLDAAGVALRKVQAQVRESKKARKL